MKNFKNLIINAALGYLGLDPELAIILDYVKIVFISLVMNIVHFMNNRNLFLFDKYIVVKTNTLPHFVTYVTSIIFLFKLSLNNLVTMHECCKS